jgi:hypothetical protein
MKYTIVFLTLLFYSCKPQTQELSVEDYNEENWSKRAANIDNHDSLQMGKSYLSVYSQMYSYTQHRKYNLTGMISMRNVSETDTIYLTKADYYDTQGSKIRTYFDYPIFVKPLETLEIVIDQVDVEGGTGSNFIFDWGIPANCPEPLFDGLMNSMQGTQGVSFTTSGKRIN